ncbi:cysteine-rich and transmembrane domain-containing protein 1 [Seriola lalandi dorsalis]|uniref:cysteine-rich and transmembrane domain-containing protein 1 n=1 Tax=Seriola lalandi dorsalis TaxID=1841481 RepID=UPI000C6F5D5C|nr:cysteine-rich and transmembrane domain-containing protein 1 [Seriola lalandi dorsalis]XP_056253495.1 cysteine-rich and transmembrane domain-containing protein 1-like isoform X1 [Seriola aureovittata]
MNGEQPPPYRPHFPEGHSAPGYPPALISQPAAFPGSSYQTFPQTYAGGDHSYYHGPPGTPGPMGPPGAFMTQPGYPGYHGGPTGAPCHWDGPRPYGEQPKQTVFVVEQQDQGGNDDSCLAACSAALCCCCLWDMMSHCSSVPDLDLH